MLAELVFPVTLKHSADMYPDSLASPPWGLMLYFSLGKQLCAGFTCLTPLPASSLSLSPTGLQCLRWPYLKTPLFVPIMHQVSGHLVVHMGVCWLARCLLPLPGYPRKEDHGPTCLSSHIQPLEHYRCCMQPQSSDAREDMLQFRR